MGLPATSGPGPPGRRLAQCPQRALATHNGARPTRAPAALAAERPRKQLSHCCRCDLREVVTPQEIFELRILPQRRHPV